MSIQQKINHEEDAFLNAYDEEVEAVLAKLNLKSDGLDSSYFDVAAYINELFPTEQSLANIDEVIADTEEQIRSLDEETRDILRGKLHSEDDGQAIVQEAMHMIKTLFSRIQDVQDRATRSEDMVRDITRDIQQLDQAKRNLTVSITALNNLLLIVNALDRLNELLGIQTPAIDDSSSNGTNSSKTTPYNPFSEDSAETTNQPVQHQQQPKLGKLTTSILLELSNLLAQAQRLLGPMLSAYGTIPSVAGLSRELDTIYSVLSDRLMKELKLLLGATRTMSDNAPIIRSACDLIDLLPKRLQVKTDLLDWFISRHLGEYKELFEPTQTTAWLDKIDHRYAWLRTNLTSLEKMIQLLFPPEWLVTERVVIQFCRLTRSDLETVMKRRQAELTHNLIIFGLQRTLTFESSLNKTYSGEVFRESQSAQSESGSKTNLAKSIKQQPLNPFDEEQQSEAEDEETQNGEKTEQSIEWTKQPFDGIISGCFDGYFHLYLSHVEKALKDQLTNRLIGDFTVNKSSLTNRDLGGVFKEDSYADRTNLNVSDSAENTLNSATDLFLLYKQIIKQTLQLNRGRGLLGLVQLLRQYLSEYTMRVLLVQIPGLNIPGVGSTGPNLSAPDVAAKMAAFGLSGLSALGIGRSQQGTGSGTDGSRQLTKSTSQNPFDASGPSTNQLFANLRDDAQSIRLSKDDVYKVCVVLVTASFCLKTVEELEKRLKMEIRPPSWASKIALSRELDEFSMCRSLCVQRLVADLEAAAEPQLAAMARLPWNNLVQVGDQSVYVTSIVKNLQEQVPLIRDTLFSVRPAFTQICIKFAGALINRFVTSLLRCKPVNTFGAEQLLLDTQSLKAALLQMPVCGSRFSQAPPRSFTNLVHDEMGRAERIIKAVMLPVGASSSKSNSSTTSASTDSVHTPSGFVMGPVDTQSAKVFLASYGQLLPDSDRSELQKVLEMKGVKTSDLQLILETFQNLNKEKIDNKKNAGSRETLAESIKTTSILSSSTTTTSTDSKSKFSLSHSQSVKKINDLDTELSLSEVHTVPSNLANLGSQQQQSTGRMGKLEKLLPKRR